MTDAEEFPAKKADHVCQGRLSEPTCHLTIAARRMISSLGRVVGGRSRYLTVETRTLTYAVVRGTLMSRAAPALSQKLMHLPAHAHACHEVAAPRMP